MIRVFLLSGLFLTACLRAATPSFAQSATLTATVRPNPLKVEISLPTPVSVNKWFEIRADISNLGTETITRTVTNIYTPSRMSVKGPKKKIGDLASGTKTIIWEAKANSSGNFIIQVEVTGKLAGEPISASDTKTIFVSGSLARLWLRLILGV